MSEIIIMGKLRGWEDPREGARNQFLWARFRQNFRSQVQVVRKAPRKLRLTPAHLQAIVATLDLEDLNDLRWATAFVMLWHTNARVGHAAPKSKKHTEHVWKFEDIVFVPNIQNAERVVVHFRSSKTRAATEDRSFWTAIGRVDLEEGQPNTCAVRLLQAWVPRAYVGNPEDPLFGSEHDRGTPILRGEFTSKLRQSLEAGAKYLAPPHNKLNTKSYSGVSFRKGSLSAMSGVVEFNRLRERADHKCPESTSHYVSDSVQTRAQSSADVHTRFGKAGIQANTAQREREIWIIPVWHSNTPRNAPAQVMVTMNTMTESGLAEDKLKFVTLHCKASAGEDIAFEQVHAELEDKVLRAAGEHAWIDGEQEAAAWLETGLEARDVKQVSQTNESTEIAVHFTSTKVASLFKAIVTGRRQSSASASIGNIAAWATGPYISACKLAENTARKDVRAWSGALRTAESWAQERIARDAEEARTQL